MAGNWNFQTIFSEDIKFGIKICPVSSGPKIGLLWTGRPCSSFVLSRKSCLSIHIHALGYNMKSTGSTYNRLWAYSGKLKWSSEEKVML